MAGLSIKPGIFVIFKNELWIPLHRMMDITKTGDEIVKWHRIARELTDWNFTGQLRCGM